MAWDQSSVGSDPSVTMSRGEYGLRTGEVSAKGAEAEARKPNWRGWERLESEMARLFGGVAIAERDWTMLRAYLEQVARMNIDSKGRFALPVASTRRSQSRKDEDDTHLGTKLEELLRALEGEPLEAGVTHSCEKGVADFVARFGHDSGGVLGAVFRTGSTRRIAESLVLFGRVEVANAELRHALVKRGLDASEVEIRDAAIQATELWEDRALGELLRTYDESVPWLAEYAAAVATNLGA